MGGVSNTTKKNSISSNFKEKLGYQLEIPFTYEQKYLLAVVIPSEGHVQGKEQVAQLMLDQNLD